MVRKTDELIRAQCIHKPTRKHAQAVTARPSLSGLNRDADVWEEDALPGGAQSTTTEAGSGEGEEKPRLSLVVIGHVDAGKSTLMGQVGVYM